MHEKAVQLLNLMFRPGEEVCVSPNKFGYRSLPLADAFGGEIELVSPHELILPEMCPTDVIQLVALNPIKGFRTDANCTAFRSFLIEMDYGLLSAQREYIDKLGMPYSAIIFSGNKSLHYLITLDRDIPDEKTYRLAAEWLLNIVTMADQNCKNPSRSIRIPGPMRDSGKKQQLVELKGLVSYSDFSVWLQKHKSAMPVTRAIAPMSGSRSFGKDIKPWMIEALTKGFDKTKGRNKQWFSIACEFALKGYSEEETLDELGNFFQEEKDFKAREWKTSIKSAFKYIYENRT